VLRVTPPDPDLARRVTRRTGQPPTQVPPAVKTPPKVLVLDDDRSIAEVAAAVLVDGYKVVVMSATNDHPTRDRASAARPWSTTRPDPAAQANRSSPASSSSTGRAQVGQYQRASRGVPQAR
jgi:hypothetical protein